MDLDNDWLKVIFAIVFNGCLLLWFRYDMKRDYKRRKAGIPTYTPHPLEEEIFPEECEFEKELIKK